MLLASLLLQTSAASAPTSAPEKLPAWLSLIYLGGLAAIVLLLVISLFRFGRARLGNPSRQTADLPREVRKRLGSTPANRGLRALRWLFAFCAIALFGFHVYWARYAEDHNEKFQELSYKDLRNGRLAE